MTKQVINIGTAPNDKTGDSLRTSFTKANANFTELYSSSIAGDWTWPEFNGVHTRALLGGSQGSWIDGQSPGGLLLYNDSAVTLNAGTKYASLSSNGNFEISGAFVSSTNVYGAGGALVGDAVSLDMTKSVHALTSGWYSVATGSEGQIMYFALSAACTVPNNIIIQFSRARFSQSLGTAMWEGANYSNKLMKMV